VAEHKYWTPAGPNVFQRKEVQIEIGDMPLILLRYQGERILERSRSGWDGYDLRQIDMSFEPYVLVTPGQSAEEKLDEMSFFIEACMNGFDLGQYSTEALLATTEYESEFDNSQPIAVGLASVRDKIHVSTPWGRFRTSGIVTMRASTTSGLDPQVQTVVVRNNFGTETYTHPEDF